MSNVLVNLMTIADEIADGTWEPSGPNLDEVRESCLTDLNDVVFNMDTWGAPSSCGYAACIVGHGLLDERTAREINPFTVVNDEVGVAPAPEFDQRLLESVFDDAFISQFSLNDARLVGHTIMRILFMPTAYSDLDIEHVLPTFKTRAQYLLDRAKEDPDTLWMSLRWIMDRGTANMWQRIAYFLREHKLPV